MIMSVDKIMKKLSVIELESQEVNLASLDTIQKDTKAVDTMLNAYVKMQDDLKAKGRELRALNDTFTKDAKALGIDPRPLTLDTIKLLGKLEFRDLK